MGRGEQKQICEVVREVIDMPHKSQTKVPTRYSASPCMIRPLTCPHNIRLKEEMWAKLSAELGVPWRSAEAMHWKLGEENMAQRAGTKRFRFSTPSTTSTVSVRTTTINAAEGDNQTARKSRRLSAPSRTPSTWRTLASRPSEVRE